MRYQSKKNIRIIQTSTKYHIFLFHTQPKRKGQSFVAVLFAVSRETFEIMLYFYYNI